MRGMPMAGQDTFNDRLARINSGKTSTMTIPGGGLATPKETRKQAVNTIPKDSFGERLAYPMSFVWAFALGVFAYAFARYATFQIGTMGFTDMDLTSVIYDLVIAGVVVFALRMLFSLDSKELTIAQGIGIFAMYTFYHNFFFWFPDQLEILFDKGYVRQIWATAEPNSFYYRGDYFVF